MLLIIISNNDYFVRSIYYERNKEAEIGRWKRKQKTGEFVYYYHYYFFKALLFKVKTIKAINKINNYLLNDSNISPIQF